VYHSTREKIAITIALRSVDREKGGYRDKTTSMDMTNLDFDYVPQDIASTVAHMEE
jgi:hypothetical protein